MEKAKEKLDIQEELTGQTTEQILKGIENCFGCDNAKMVLTDYAEYIRLNKKGKFFIGNQNIILYRTKTNIDYTQLLNIVVKLLYKEGIIESTEFEIVKDIYKIRNIVLEKKLYVLDDENIREDKINEIVDSNSNAVFVLIIYDKEDSIGTRNYYSKVDNLRNKFFWELTLIEPSDEEKIRYIKNAIKQHSFTNKTTDKELKALTIYDLETIDKCLISAFIKANKQKSTYISAQELNIMKNPNYKLGMKKLDKLVGLEAVKEQVKQIIDYVQVHKNRNSISPTLHMVFKGNPRNRKNRSSKDNRRNL